MLFDELDPLCDPLSPNNKIFFGTGPTGACHNKGCGEPQWSDEPSPKYKPISELGLEKEFIENINKFTIWGKAKNRIGIW